MKQRSLASGFSLVELMIGMAIGLLCVLVIATVLGAAEGNRRGTTSGSDAQISGNLALYTLQTEMGRAGYGFASEAKAVGCPLDARFNGAATPELPPVLAPVTITAGPLTGSDTVRVLASSKAIDAVGLNSSAFTVPQRLLPPYYAAGSQVVPVRSVLSYQVGDLVVLVSSPGLPCELFQVTGLAAPGGATNPVLQRADQAPWNSIGFPANTAYGPCTILPDCQPGAPVDPAGSFVFNLGRIQDQIFSVQGDRLVVSELNSATMTRTARDIQSGVVMLKAMYGRDADGDGAVDTYDRTAPLTQAGWLSVLSVRIAVVARTGQYERAEVTTSYPLWRVGKAAATEGAIDCGSTRCVELNLSAVPDWKHYRYRVFDTVVALRNQRMKSGVPVAAPAPSAPSAPASGA